MKILAISPHTDDAELGCGASLARWIDEGHTVMLYGLSTGNKETGAIRDEFIEAMEILNLGEDWRLGSFVARWFQKQRQEILQRLIDVYGNWPDLVIGPSLHDRHQDHQVVAAEMIRAFPYCSILAYEAKRSSDQVLDYYVKIKHAHLNRKIAAIQCYQSQFHRSYMDADYLTSLARVRGNECGVEFAEAFEIVRWIE